MSAFQAKYAFDQFRVFRRLAAISDLSLTASQFRSHYIGAAQGLSLVHSLSIDAATRITAEFIEPLRALADSQYWYPSGNLHITIKNIRQAKGGATFDESFLNHVRDATERACKHASPMTFLIIGPVILNNSIALRAIASGAFRDFVRLLSRELSLEGIEDDRRYIVPDVPVANITICRFTSHPADVLKKSVSRARRRLSGLYTACTASLALCDEVYSSETRRIIEGFRFPVAQ